MSYHKSFVFFLILFLVITSQPVCLKAANSSIQKAHLTSPVILSQKYISLSERPFDPKTVNLDAQSAAFGFLKSLNIDQVGNLNSELSSEKINFHSLEATSSLKDFFKVSQTQQEDFYLLIDTTHKIPIAIAKTSQAGSKKFIELINLKDGLSSKQRESVLSVTQQLGPANGNRELIFKSFRPIKGSNLFTFRQAKIDGWKKPVTFFPGVEESSITSGKLDKKILSLFQPTERILHIVNNKTLATKLQSNNPTIQLTANDSLEIKNWLWNRLNHNQVQDVMNLSDLVRKAPLNAPYDHLFLSLETQASFDEFIDWLPRLPHLIKKEGSVIFQVPKKIFQEFRKTEAYYMMNAFTRVNKTPVKGAYQLTLDLTKDIGPENHLDFILTFGVDFFKFWIYENSRSKELPVITTSLLNDDNTVNSNNFKILKQIEKSSPNIANAYLSILRYQNAIRFSETNPISLEQKNRQTKPKAIASDLSGTLVKQTRLGNQLESIITAANNYKVPFYIITGGSLVPEEKELLQKELKEKFFCYERHNGWRKGLAILEIALMLNISIDEIIKFGDAPSVKADGYMLIGKWAYQVGHYETYDYFFVEHKPFLNSRSVFNTLAREKPFEIEETTSVDISPLEAA